jgi:bifunctional ADP-heptose synthase (sugar kinase/adenylyltransferase)
MHKVLIIGETCVDKFVYSNAKRLCPEAPVPVLNPVKTISNQGMAGNTVANVKAIVPDYMVMSLNQTENITKTRYVEEKSNHMFFRVDEGEDTISQFKWSMDIDVVLAQADIVIVSDYNKGFLTNADLKEIGRKAKLSILDSKRKLTDDIVNSFSFVKLNESESKSNPDLTADNIVTTLGKRGAEYKGVVYESPDPQDTIDVSGAGDTFTAAFIIKYHQLKDERAAIKFANRMAAEVVSKRGVAVPTKID